MLPADTPDVLAAAAVALARRVEELGGLRGDPPWAHLLPVAG